VCKLGVFCAPEIGRKPADRQLCVCVCVCVCACVCVCVWVCVHESGG